MRFGLQGGEEGGGEKWTVSGKCPPETFTLHQTSQLHENTNEKTNLGHKGSAVQHTDLHKLK